MSVLLTSDTTELFNKLLFRCKDHLPHTSILLLSSTEFVK